MSTHVAPLVVGRHRSSVPAAKPVAREAAPVRGRGSLARRLVGLGVSGVLVVAMLGFLLLAVGPHVFGYRTATMLTASMAPGINPGDVVVSVPVLASEVEVGDVITYHIPIEDHRVETHRVTEVITQEDGSIAVKTQGDANPNVDPWVATLEGDTVWEMQAVVPHLGTAIQALRTPFVQDGVIWAALLVVLGLGMNTIWSTSGSRGERE